MTARRLEIFVIVVIIAVIGVVYALTRQPILAPDSNNQTQNPGIAVGEINPSMVVEYKGEEGKNALELLRANYNVETKNYSFGEMVTSINGIVADDKHFWAMYVNDQMSQVGASEYKTKSGDNIQWKLEEIKF